LRQWTWALLAGAIGIASLVGAAAASAACDPACPPPAAAGDQDTLAAAQLLAFANADRTAAGLRPLTARDDVAAIAFEQSKKMAAAGDIWHNDAYFTADTRNRLDAKTLGENVAMNRSMDDAHSRLMASPGHRANLMDPRFSVVGIGVVRDAAGIGYITEDFVEPRPPAPPSALPAPPILPVVAPPPPAQPSQPAASDPTETFGDAGGLGGDAPSASSTGPTAAPASGTVASFSSNDPNAASEDVARSLEGDFASGAGELAAGPHSRHATSAARRLPGLIVLAALLAVAANVLLVFRSRRRRIATV
jgi:uncharacterized protein YkwD